MKKISFFFSLVLALSSCSLHAQPDRWQQRVKYQINVNMNVNTNQFTGTELVDYWNNSPDTLSRIFIHLYWNAFQPNSMMDIRSQEQGKTVLRHDVKGNPIYDWDGRIRDRLGKLDSNEIGFQRIHSIKINGVAQQLIDHETILEVQLSKPLLPKTKTTFDISFTAQVPVQIRRSGRNNAEGVQFSMAQWYPKIAEYDYQGWNAVPYIAREFYGVWGDYDVNITIDKKYMLGATGTLINANEIGFGYEQKSIAVKPPAGNTLTWKFSAQNVHDFVWAADPDFKLITRTVPNGPTIYVVHKKVDSLEDEWQKLADTTALIYPLIEKTFGKYPYKNYSFIQGGDGGMEYPMATLVKNASIGTGVHEWMHSWYQGMMGSNETLYPWMDEGFTSYGEERVLGTIRNKQGLLWDNEYRGYFDLVKSGKEEPLSTPGDFFSTNYAYARAAYSKGCVFMAQLGYIVGNQTLDKILLEYYNQWRFKHPNPNDFIRVAEKVSGIELKWYKEYFVYSTKTIDYAIGNVNNEDNKAVITLKRAGLMPMPVDVLITYKDGTQELHYIPMNLMYGQKPAEDNTQRFVHQEWKWTHPEYQLQLNKNVAEIKEIEIDPSQRMADVNRINNKLTVPN